MLTKTQLAEQTDFHFQPRSLMLFSASAIVAWGLNLFGQTAFPPVSPLPCFIRAMITLILALALGKLSFTLLKKNGLSPRVLGLYVSPQALSNVSLGILIGLITTILFACGLYVFNPYRMTTGNLHGWMLFNEGVGYLLNNALEELMFRGFLLVLLIRMLDWRKAALIMALPFGLFHLPFLGLTMAGLKMVLTTMTLSFLFSYAFILTGSLWTAVAVHASMNVLNHALLGLDGAGRAAYLPVFSRQWPTGYDPGFIVTITVGTVVAMGLFLWVRSKMHPAILFNEETH